MFPAWQGMQYTRDMFSGRVRLGSLDNERYPELTFTTVEDKFSRGVLESAGVARRSERVLAQRPLTSSLPSSGAAPS